MTHNRNIQTDPRAAGFTLLELGLVVLIIGILATLALPMFLNARKHANESMAISALRSVGNAQEMYHRRNGEYATIGELVASGDLDTTFNGDRRGYLFADSVPPTESIWSVTAQPEAPGTTGDRSFFIDLSGVIRFADGAPADASSQPVH